mmetsp:Transcript_367/g.1135  ORF Transcript_367/g.1135 Transcript_367/m.1135 type:complete len:254 (-) Transcript_367:1027-1788(-)
MFLLLFHFFFTIGRTVQPSISLRTFLGPNLDCTTLSSSEATVTLRDGHSFVNCTRDSNGSFNPTAISAWAHRHEGATLTLWRRDLERLHHFDISNNNLYIVFGAEEEQRKEKGEGRWWLAGGDGTPDVCALRLSPLVSADRNRVVCPRLSLSLSPAEATAASCLFPRRPHSFHCVGPGDSERQPFVHPAREQDTPVASRPTVPKRTGLRCDATTGYCADGDCFDLINCGGDWWQADSVSQPPSHTRSHQRTEL